jgi:CMP-N-acetylneuraminic acid synthetase
LEKEKYSPDIIVVLHVISPLKKAEHITEAINTLLIFGVDSVISVCKDLKFHWKPGMHGLTPLYEKRLLKQDKETLYRENGAIYVTKREVLERGDVIGKSVGHITMHENESVHIDSEYDFWLAEQILKRKNTN